MMLRLKTSWGAPLRRPASWILRRLAGRRRATFQEERTRVFGHSPKITAAMEAPTRYFPKTEMHPIHLGSFRFSGIRRQPVRAARMQAITKIGRLNFSVQMERCGRQKCNRLL